MKKYIAITLLFVFALLASYLGFQKFRNRQITQCLSDPRMAQSVWATYVSKEFKFSVEHPLVLVPQQQGRFAVVSFRTKTEPYSGTPLGVDIYINDIRPDNKDKVSGIKSYQCESFPIGGGPNKKVQIRNGFITSADIYHGSSIYSFSIVGMNLQEAERMVNSIKFQK